MNNQSLNLTGRIVKIFIASKLTILFIVASSLLGLVAIFFTPREENPQIIVPGAKVMMTMPGASSEEIEELIVAPLEGVIREISGVDHTFAMARNSLAIVSVQFEVGENKEKSLIKIYDKILGNRSIFPKEATDPVITSVDVDDVPIVTITLASDKYSDYALKRLADNMIERLSSIKEVSVTYVKGGCNREIGVELDPDRLQAFGITLDQIQSVMSTNNLSAPIGTLAQNGENRSIYLDAFFKSVQDVAHIVVGTHNNKPIYLEDVADIIDGPPKERKTLSRFAFGPADERFGKTSVYEMPAVILAVAKKPGTNSVVVSKDIIKRIKEIQQNFVPSDIHVIVTRNDGEKANAAVNLLLKHLGIAILSVFIIIALFLGLKEAILVGITVPLILSLTLFTDFAGGPTINRITMFGLIVSLGMLVDAAIVVLENIHRHYARGENKSKTRITIIAVNEIANPTNIATFAVIAVFTSLFVITGVMRQYFYPIVYNVPVAMFASLVVAYVVIPWAANLWLQFGESHKPKKFDFIDLILRPYKVLMTYLLDNFKAQCIVLIIVVLLLAVSILQPLWQFIRPQGMGGPISAGCVSIATLPKDDKNTFNISIDMPEFTPVEVTDQVAREVGGLLRSNPYITNYQSFIGMAGVIDFNGLLRGTGDKRCPNFSEIRVNLIDKQKRDVSSIEIVRNLRPFVEKIRTKYPKCIIKLVEDSPGPPVLATVLSEIYGPDPKVLRKIADKISREYEKTYDIVEVHDSEVEDVNEYRIVIDREKAALSGILPAQIVQTLRRLVAGESFGRIHKKGEKNTIPIRLHVPRKYQIDPDVMAKIFITNQKGQKIPLSEVTKIIHSSVDRPIFHKDYEKMTFVGAELVSTSPVYAVCDLNRRLKNLDIGDGIKLSTGNLGLIEAVPDTINGYQLLWGGEMRITLDMFRDMVGALIIAISLILLLLVGYYRSFSIPLVAAVSVPLGIVGVFPGHLIMNQHFSGTSMIGVVALAGVVVRNSLLIIDFAIDNLKKGMTLKNAVYQAGVIRFRPILLTAMAVVLGIAVLLTDPVFGGLSISIIFGTLTSTFLSMIVTPILIYMLFKKKDLTVYKDK